MNNPDKTYVLSMDSRCNQRCLICMKKKALSSKKLITFEKISQEIFKAKEQGFTKIDFYGGEPLAYPFTAKAVKWANQLSLACFLATNATKFASRDYTSAFFKGLKIQEVRTSLHGAGPKIHDRVTRVPGSFHKTMRGIRNILELGHTRVSVNIVINALNYKDLPGMTDMIHDQGVTCVTYSGLVFEGEITHHPGLLVDMVKIKPYLGRAIKKYLKPRLSAKIIKLPLCILDKKLRTPRFCVPEESGHFIKGRLCAGCRRQDICPGMSRHQISAFGVPSFMNNV